MVGLAAATRWSTCENTGSFSNVTTIRIESYVFTVIDAACCAGAIAVAREEIGVCSAYGSLNRRRIGNWIGSHKRAEKRNEKNC